MKDLLLNEIEIELIKEALNTKEFYEKLSLADLETVKILVIALNKI